MNPLTLELTRIINNEYSDQLEKKDILQNNYQIDGAISECGIGNERVIMTNGMRNEIRGMF